MKSFLFITALTPDSYLTPLRKALQEIFLCALKNQVYKNWRALLIGEYEKQEDNIYYIKTTCTGKIEKHQFILEYLKNIRPVPDYLIRLDDDDLISPTLLYQITDNNENFDCYADMFHAYYDIVSGKICQVKNAWLPNTIVHKFDHALALYGEKQTPLYLHDHNESWMEYYRNKKIIWAEKQEPVYLRIMSPATQTSGMHSLLLNEFNQGVLKQYDNKIQKIGTWKDIQIGSFNTYFPLLKKIWKEIIRRKYQICTNCVLDTNDDNNIEFNEHGICNYCNYYCTSVRALGTDEDKTTWLNNKVKEIKAKNKRKQYHCILGISGGVDSTYLAYWCKQNNLSPLVVHFDNGWDSELAIKNIENICTILQFHLHTYVINWEEFKQLQVAYFKAGVIDIEALTDHAIHATLIKISKEYKIRYILNGNNLSTEAIMPKDWVFDKLDWENIKDIYSRFGSGRSIKTFPHISFFQKLWNYWFLKIEDIQVLNYLNYNKQEAKAVITEKLGWRDYGGKHHESVFTKFYQSYVLPVKFKVDKRKAHLSTLICSGQITKDEALESLNKTTISESVLEEEKKYVLKKLEISCEEFDGYMKELPRLHTDFKTEKGMWQRYFKAIKLMRFWRQ